MLSLVPENTQQLLQELRSRISDDSKGKCQNFRATIFSGIRAAYIAAQSK
jgi:hypothetical protein